MARYGEIIYELDLLPLAIVVVALVTVITFNAAFHFLRYYTLQVQEEEEIYADEQAAQRRGSLEMWYMQKLLERDEEARRMRQLMRANRADKEKLTRVAQEMRLNRDGEQSPAQKKPS